MLDPRTPVIIGVGQVDQPVDPVAAVEPLGLFERAARRAADDCGARRDPLAVLDTVATVEILSWRYADVGAALARRLGCGPVRTVRSTTGGNGPQLLLTRMAAAIQRGEHRAVLLGGAEAMGSRLRARYVGTRLPWAPGAPGPPARAIGDPRPGTDAGEDAHGAGPPAHTYPLFETAIRAAAGRSVRDHQDVVATLWATFSDVAAANPHAWSRVAYDATAIATPGPDNRVVAFPYTKRMVANMNVDQGAALLLVAYEVARDLGVPDDRLVFPLAGADAHDHFHFTTRAHLDRSPAIRAVGAAALGATAIGMDDVARFDLYSCFPSAVQIAMSELGLAGPAGRDPRPLTVTGGLAFAGGPMNNYSTHAIAAMVDACRRDPGSIGLVTALGWYVTKHAMGVYSTTPSPRGFVAAPSPQDEIDSLPACRVERSYVGRATVEATSVVMRRDGTPDVGILSLRTPTGARTLANIRDTTALTDMTIRAWEGDQVRVVTDGTTNTVEY